MTTYEEFTAVFREVMRYVSGVEYYHYIHAIKADNAAEEERKFLEFLEEYIISHYVTKGFLPEEDLPVLMKKLKQSEKKLKIA